MEKNIMNKNKNPDDERKTFGASKTDVIIPVPVSLQEMPSEYMGFLSKIKTFIKSERIKSILSANATMVMMYWEIGYLILNLQNSNGWGAKVIDRLSYDLKTSFPDMSGFSPRNLKYMRKFAKEWPEREIVQRTVALIPWRSNITLLDKLTDKNSRLWYAQKTLELGLGKDMLAIQIETKLYERQGKAISNFNEALPPLESDMASQVFKDPYIFDFLGTDDPRREAELEQKLIDHIQKFLLELGQGFAFVGRQMHLEVGGDDFIIDLLFYHLKLRCYIVVELKSGKFEPGYVSQINMYLNIVDDLLKHPDDKPSIGLLLVKSKNQMVVEYALSGYLNPIGVANWEREISQSLPDNLKPSLPTIEEIELEMEKENSFE
jgi:predicted nuclease of restriction endonuclease-like (RecB) superfamily